VQSRQAQDVYGCTFAQMVAWETVFPLHRCETNEVFGRTPILRLIAKWGPLPEAADVM